MISDFLQGVISGVIIASVSIAFGFLVSNVDAITIQQGVSETSVNGDVYKIDITRVYEINKGRKNEKIHNKKYQ